MATVLFFWCWKMSSRVPNSPIVSSCAESLLVGSAIDVGTSGGVPKYAVSLRICSVELGSGSSNGDLPGRRALKRLMNSAPLR